MPNITQIQVGTTTYDIIDSTASTEINEIKEISLKAQYNENTETIEFSQGISSITSSGGGNIDIIWGNISGTLSNQTDLNTALNGKAASSHTHDYSTDINNKPTLGTMAAINDAPSDSKEYVRKNGAWTEASGGSGGSSLPSGGTIGQVLAKNSNTDGDVGWYFIHKLPTDKWYLPTGIQESQVIAAYQFIGRSSEAEALININDGTKYTLLKHLGTETWNAATGFIIPGTKAAGLYSTELGSLYPSVLSAAFGFSGADVLTSNKIGPGIFLNSYRILSLRGGTAGSTYTNAPCINQTDLNTINSYKAGRLYDKGVLSGIWSSPSKIYIDGEELSLVTASNFDNSDTLHGDMAFAIQNGWANPTGCNVTALVFYSTILSAEQHIELSYNIRTLGGIN